MEHICFVTSRQAMSAVESRFGMLETLTPGALIRHPKHPEWGLGQVQSVIGNRLTANFEHHGKVVINISVVTLDVVEDAD